MKNIHIHPKFNKVYEATAKSYIAPTIGNGRFEAGEKVVFALAIRQEMLESMVSDKISEWKKGCGGQWVMCEDVQDQVAERYEAEILDDINNYQVFVIGEAGGDNVCDFTEAKELYKTTGKYFPAITPEKIVEDTIYKHNCRVW